MLPHRGVAAGAPGERVRLCFLSYPPLSRLALDVMQEFADRAQIEVVDASFDSALAAASERERRGEVDAFVSAGSNAAILRGVLASPVATIKVDGYDLLSALMQARRHTRRVGVVTFRDTIAPLESVRQLLKIDVAQRAYRSPAEARERVRALAAEGYEVMVGSSIVVETAEQQGLRGILAYSPASVRQGLEEAIELARVSRLEAARYERLDGILRSLQEAVVAVDAGHRVTAASIPMATLLRRPVEELAGQRLEELAPELSLRETLRTGAERRGEVLEFAGRTWICNRTPVREQGRVGGAVMALHDARRIQQADSSLRAQRRGAAPHRARYTFADLVGGSPAFARARETAQRYAETDGTVLILGDSGTGKELFAQAIHQASARAHRPFVAVNCSALPETLLESELFGYEEGAFTGSRRGGKQGLFEIAHTGTLFLDEIGDMPRPLQSRLLRVLQEREVMRLGSTAPIPVDVRVIAATHQPLDALVRQARFRADLYYRLAILQLALPPLRQRAEDLEPLALALLQRHLARLGARVPAGEILPLVLPRLRCHDWPGNVRELENACERIAVFTAPCATLGAVDRGLLAAACPRASDPSAEGRAPQARAPAPSVLEVLAACGGSRQEAARRLGVSRATLWRRMRREAQR